MRLLTRAALLFSLVVQTTEVSAQEQVAAAAPTVRLWATREGLVGRTTASGHLITENDHFVALPSRKALNKSVIVSYRGKAVTTTVLAIGPWNRDDAWWEVGAARGQFQRDPVDGPGPALAQCRELHIGHRRRTGRDARAAGLSA